MVGFLGCLCYLEHHCLFFFAFKENSGLNRKLTQALIILKIIKAKKPKYTICPNFNWYLGNEDEMKEMKMKS